MPRNLYLTTCVICVGNTSRKYARENDGKCKTCAESPREIQQQIKVATHGLRFGRSVRGDLERFDVGHQNDVRFGTTED